ncbi:hypothetical protein HFP72_24305 [Nocardiopsis sp. ARC36]
MGTAQGDSGPPPACAEIGRVPRTGPGKVTPEGEESSAVAVRAEDQPTPMNSTMFAAT